jgi:hypothetical protein
MAHSGGRADSTRADGGERADGELGEHADGTGDERAAIGGRRATDR